jgi:aromatic amino acid transport protein AroP
MMRQLGEMVVEEPVSGSFSYFAYKFWSLAGFMSAGTIGCSMSWSHGGTQCHGLYVQYWWPEIPTWISALGFFVLINAINLLHVKVFGETEFYSP